MAAKIITAPQVQEEIWDAIERVRTNQSRSCLIQLSADEASFVLKNSLPKDASWEQVVAPLDEQTVSWMFVDFPYRTTNGGIRNKLIYLVYVPDTLRRETMRETVRVKSSALHLSGAMAKYATAHAAIRFQANEVDDLEPWDVLKKCAQHERDDIDKQSVVTLLGLDNLVKCA